MQNGIKICTNKTKINKVYNRIEKIFCKKNFSSFSQDLSCNLSTKIGTNTELKAPSAKILRKKLGTLKAAKKASETILTPTYLAIRMSRINPNIRDNDMKKETVKKERNISCDDLI
jgi:hypothetical protein